MGGVLIVNVVLVYAGPSTSLYFSVSYLDWVGRNDQHRNLNINNIVGHIPVTFGECPNEYSFKGNFSKAKAISGQPWTMKLLLRVLSSGELLLVFNCSSSDWPRLKNGYKVFSASNWNLGWSSDGSQHSCLKMAESFEKGKFCCGKVYSSVGFSCSQKLHCLCKISGQSSSCFEELQRFSNISGATSCDLWSAISSIASAR